MKIAKRLKSNVLASNAYHHRVDGLTAIVALLMIVGSRFWSHGLWLDPAGSLVITWMVLRTGWAITKESFLELLDVSFDEDERERVHKVVVEALKACDVSKEKVAAKISGIEGTKSGRNYLVDVVLVVQGSCSVDGTSAVSESVGAKVRAELKEVKRLKIEFISTEAVERRLGK